MCPIVVAIVAVVASIAKSVSENRAMRRQEKALNQENAVRAKQIDDQASADMNERARAVRRAKASARATASEAGVNLDSGSFLAQLQNFNAQEDLQAGLVTTNKKNAQLARDAEYRSALSHISYKNGLGIVLDAAAAGISAYAGAGGNMSFSSSPSGTSGMQTQNMSVSNNGTHGPI